MTRANAELSPTNPQVVASWLFANEPPQLADGESDDWHEYQRLLADRRTAAVRNLLDTIGTKSLLDWSVSLPDQHAFGLSLAAATTESEDTDLANPMLSAVRADAREPPIVLLAYVAWRLAERREGWLARWLVYRL